MGIDGIEVIVDIDFIGIGIAEINPAPDIVNAFLDPAIVTEGKQILLGSLAASEN